MYKKDRSKSKMEDIQKAITKYNSIKINKKIKILVRKIILNKWIGYKHKNRAIISRERNIIYSKIINIQSIYLLETYFIPSI